MDDSNSVFPPVLPLTPDLAPPGLLIFTSSCTIDDALTANSMKKVLDCCVFVAAAVAAGGAAVAVTAAKLAVAFA